MGDYFKRKNSLGILYLNREKANVDDVLEVLTKMSVSIQDVYGIQQIGFGKIIVKLQDQAAELFDHLMRAYEDRIFTLAERNISVQIVNLSISKVVVTIKNAPFELPQYLLNDMLAQYGQVYNIRTQTFTSGNYRGIYNGIKTSLMTLNKPIPSSIVLGRVNLLVSYKGQPLTCLKCGYPGHFAADCTVGYWEAVNRINDRDFPELRKEKEACSEKNAKKDDVTPGNDGTTAESNSNTLSKENMSAAHSSDISDMDEIVSVSQEVRSDKIQAENVTPQDEDIHDEIVTSPHLEVAENLVVDDLININSSPDGFCFDVASVEVHVNENEKAEDYEEDEPGESSQGSEMDKVEGQSKDREIFESGNGEENEGVKDSNWQTPIKRKKKKKEVKKVCNMRKNVRSVIDMKRLSKKRKHTVTDLLAEEVGKLTNLPSCDEDNDNLMDINVNTTE